MKTDVKTALFDTLCEFWVSESGGGFTKMIDYQAAGKTWDENSLTEAWLPALVHKTRC